MFFLDLCKNDLPNQPIAVISINCTVQYSDSINCTVQCGTVQQKLPNLSEEVTMQPKCRSYPTKWISYIWYRYQSTIMTASKIVSLIKFQIYIDQAERDKKQYLTELEQYQKSDSYKRFLEQRENALKGTRNSILTYCIIQYEKKSDIYFYLILQFSSKKRKHQ